MNAIGLYLFFAFWHWSWHWFYVKEYREDYLFGIILLVIYHLLIELFGLKDE